MRKFFLHWNQVDESRCFDYTGMLQREKMKAGAGESPIDFAPAPPEIAEDFVVVDDNEEVKNANLFSQPNVDIGLQIDREANVGGGNAAVHREEDSTQADFTFDEEVDIDSVNS